MNESAIKARIEQLLRLDTGGGGDVVVNELLQGTLTLMVAVYGPDSHQVGILMDPAKKRFPMDLLEVLNAAKGALRNLQAELEAGAIGSLIQRMVGDVLTDFLQLARAVLDDPSDKAKNVAAVLTAAAFEDTIRRMGESFAGVVGRDDLQGVINELKQKGILQSPQLAIAQSYLSFRNHALHAEWVKIDRASVHSVLGFVEQLLLKHFQ